MGLEVLPGSRARPRGVSFVNCLRAIDETHLYGGLAHNGGNIAKQQLKLGNAHTYPNKLGFGASPFFKLGEEK